MSEEITPEQISQKRQEREQNIIMIADDDMFTRTIISKSVKEYGEIVEIFDGSAVTDTYKTVMPNVLFLDIHLPKKNGFEALDEILECDHDAYVVMVSSDSGQENIAKAIKAGAAEFVSKPFVKKKLEQACLKCPSLKGV